MFRPKRVFVSHGDRHVNIRENRAPTDESVRLLREMEDAAENKVIQSIKIGNNIWSGEIQLYTNEADQSHVARMIFDLNGERHVLEESVLYRDQTREDLIVKLKDRVAEVVASVIVQSLMMEAGR